MKRGTLVVAIALFCAVFLLSCTDKPGPWMQDKEKYVKATAEKLKEYEIKLADLKARGEKMQGEEGADLRKAVEGLQQKHRLISQELEDLKKTAGGVYLDMKSYVNNMIAEFEKSYADLSSKTGA